MAERPFRPVRMLVLNRRVAVMVLALSCFLILVSLVKGNLQIAAWPCALWVGLTNWPPRSKRCDTGPAGHGMERTRVADWERLGLSVTVLLCAFALTTWRVAGGVGPHVSDVEAQMSKGEQLARRGRLGEALAVFQSIDVPRGMPIQLARKHHNCGVLLLQLGRPDDAVTDLLLSLEYDAGNAQAAFLIGKVLADRDDRQGALHMLELSFSIDPRYEPANRLRKRLTGSVHAERTVQDGR